MTEFTRKELQQIVSKARRMTSEELNPLWKRACERLADAAWALDAIMARTEEK
ncbi:unnamed protein product [marine sediment metagenome]|uniref:Uncharacterized protein n=1 Tax=marine sediment metagenome TaxID=412755 RepID=X1C7Y6_9ZZZZ